MKEVNQPATLALGSSFSDPRPTAPEAVHNTLDSPRAPSKTEKNIATNTEI